MAFRGLANLAIAGLALLVASCGGGSGRAGTDLVVVGVGPSARVNGGDPVVFVMTVSNQGKYAADNVTIRNSTLQLSLPGLKLACTADGGATCPDLLGPTMTVPLLPVGGSLVFEVTSTANVGASGSVSDTMSVSAEDADTNRDNNTFTVSSSVASNDVGVTGTAPAGPLLGGPATFTMVVNNAGPDEALGVVLTTTVGANLTLQPGAIVCTGSGGAAVPTLQPDGTLLSTSIPMNAALTCAVPVTVGTAGTATSAFAVVSMAASAAGDGRPSNNSATASVSATLSNNIGVTGTALTPSVIGGQTTTFTAVVSNSGPSTAFDVALDATLGANLTLAGTIACMPSGGAVAPVSTTGGGLTSPSVPVGGALTCTLPLTVSAGANGTVAATFTATAAGDQRASDNSATVTTLAVSSNLGVSQSGATQVAAGTTTAFTALVSNPGPGVASNLRITWSHSDSADVVFATPTCTATSGATCPTALGPAMTVPSLGIGRTLAFTFNATPGSGFRGAIVNTVAVASDEDQDLSNNSASASTLAVDSRNGSYTVFAADGRSYTLAIDFDAGQYTLAGNATSTTHNFTLEAATGDYVVSGNVRLRAGPDLLIGGHDFGSGVLPFIAARNFTTALAGLAGSYNLATRNVVGAGTATTRPGTALISGNTLSICQSDAVDVAQVRNCLPEARKDYLNLVVSGDVVTGATITGETYSFSLASSGAAKVLLSTGQAIDGSAQLRIGLIDSTAGYTYGPPLRGPSSTGDWLALALTSGTQPVFTATGSSTVDSVSLVSIGNSGAGPFSMLEGTSPTYNALVYVMQAYPLVITVGGAPGYAGASTGLLQIGLP